MIRRNKLQLLLSSILILLPMFAGLFLWFFFPSLFASHWEADNPASGPGSKIFAVTVLPVLLLSAHWFCVYVTNKDSKNRHQNRTLLGIVFWICPIISIFASGVTYAAAFGHDFGNRILICLPIALIYLVLGNYLPKCRQNHTIGIRVLWTLQDEENWNKTHRFTGKLWVFGALLLLFSVFLPEKISMYVFWLILLLITSLPFLYSFLYYREQLKAGKITKGQISATAKEKRSNTLVSVSICIVLLITGFLLVSGDIKIRFSDVSFTIESLYWEDATIPYSDIDEIEYREQCSAGSRTFGFGSFTLQMGEFKNEEFGTYTRYTYANCDPCIVVTVHDKILVLNGKDEDSTKEIYTMINQKINEQKGE